MSKRLPSVLMSKISGKRGRAKARLVKELPPLRDAKFAHWTWRCYWRACWRALALAFRGAVFGREWRFEGVRSPLIGDEMITIGKRRYRAVPHVTVKTIDDGGMGIYKPAYDDHGQHIGYYINPEIIKAIRETRPFRSPRVLPSWARGSKNER